MANPLVITREQLIAAGACSLATFDKRKAPSGDLVYPKGFDRSERLAAAKNNPVEFLWLVTNALVPCSLADAVAAVTDSHGADFVDELRSRRPAAVVPQGAAPRPNFVALMGRKVQPKPAPVKKPAR